MINRKLLPILLEMLDNFRIVAINGPRQSGKTTLQKEISKLKDYRYYNIRRSRHIQHCVQRSTGVYCFYFKRQGGY